MTSAETLNRISQQLNIYLGITIFILGIIGSVWNILIFRHYFFRSSSCCIYMLVGTLASFTQIIFGLLVRILADGFGINPTARIIVWCKIRNYVTLCASMTALSCLVWTSVDRFLSTCRQIKWRHFNSLFVARQVCLLTLIFWMSFCIPTLVYSRPLESTGTCGSASMVWTRVTTYFLNLVCYGICPWVLTGVFGILTLRNLRHMHHRRVNPALTPVVTRSTRMDQQLTSMLFLQIIIATISSVPYCVQNLYDNLTRTVNKSEYRQAQENLFLQIVRLAFYLNYVSMFYVNYISSVVFRRLSRKVLANLFKTKDEVSRDVTVINHQVNAGQIARSKPKVFAKPVLNVISGV
jgi:hypothetical protein